MDAEVRQQILEQVERFVRERVSPRAASIDEEDEFPRDLWNDAARLGLFGLGIPEDYGGLGRDLVTPLLISERTITIPTFKIRLERREVEQWPIRSWHW